MKKIIYLTCIFFVYIDTLCMEQELLNIAQQKKEANRQEELFLNPIEYERKIAENKRIRQEIAELKAQANRIEEDKKNESFKKQCGLCAILVGTLVGTFSVGLILGGSIVYLTT